MVHLNQKLQPSPKMPLNRLSTKTHRKTQSRRRQGRTSWELSGVSFGLKGRHGAPEAALSIVWEINRANRSYNATKYKQPYQIIIIILSSVILYVSDCLHSNCKSPPPQLGEPSVGLHPQHCLKRTVYGSKSYNQLKLHPLNGFNIPFRSSY